uniref:Glycosyltransferase-like protein LARGE2 n=1 Tax=Calcidiscus leptoporus TaxID=127549 RepID=A0A7S0J5T3_9EUKA|mmetsp:Transcript_3941/g.8920  ORF Transcript_3941/g.8920 Transcript_3941/m.8920 type:complete len:454 (+) Transcript_3941:140-1501(+)
MAAKRAAVVDLSDCEGAVHCGGMGCNGYHPGHDGGLYSSRLLLHTKRKTSSSTGLRTRIFSALLICSSIILALNFYWTHAIFVKMPAGVPRKASPNAAEVPLAGAEVDQEEAEESREERDLTDELIQAEDTPEQRLIDDKLEGGIADDRVSMDVTFVSQTSEDRVWMVEHLVKRWGGAISIAVYVVTEKEIKLHRKRLAKIGRQPGSSIIEVRGRLSDGYPINALRNVALKAVRTSHFLLSDIDLWPSVDSYNEILAHGSALTAETHTALVLPAFEFATSTPKDELSRIKVREAVAKELPETFGQLRECFRVGKPPRCRIFKSSTDTHLSTSYDRWWRASERYRISCFHSLRYEPYLVLPSRNSTPMFDERFLGYGKNKIQWIQHLRLSGFSFHVLPQAFVIHCPHPTSASRQNWAAYKSKKDRLFRDFIRDRLLNATVRTRMCKHVNWGLVK